MTEETTAEKGREMDKEWLTERFCLQVEDAVREDTDALAMLIYGNKEHGNALCPLNMIHLPTFQMVLEFATESLAKDYGKADWIALCSETYIHAPIEPGQPHPGDLQALFNAGDPNVAEAAMIHFVRSDGTGYGWIRSYKRVESVLNGETIPIWDDPRTDEFTADEVRLEGGVPRILLNATKWSEG